ncbi:MFS transporter, partial [Acinetobacter baumannii]
GTFIPMILEKLGMHDGILGGLFLNTFAVLGTIAAVILIERISRRNVAIMPFVLSTIALLVIALSDDSSNLIIIGFLVYAFVSAGAACVLSVIPSEVLRPDASAMGTGFATAFSRIGAAIGVFLMPQLILEHGASLAVWLATGICLITTVVTYLFMPETKGKSMSEIFH